MVIASARRTPAPPPESLPRLSADARFVPEQELDGMPHIVADGRTAAGAVLELSHWPGCATPPAFAALTATEIVARYLDAGPCGPEVGAVANNHFDLDGLLAVWVLAGGVGPGPLRDLAIRVAAIGDFGVWDDPAAAKAAFALTYLSEPSTSPLSSVHRAMRGAVAGDPCGELYGAMLPRVGRLLEDPDRAEPFSSPGWQALAADLDLVDSGTATIRELPEWDLAVLRSPRPLPRMAVVPRTDRMRILTITDDGSMVLEQRYETWVAFCARPQQPRADLTGCAAALNARETGTGRWQFEGLGQSTPRLGCWNADGSPASSRIHPDEVLDRIVESLARVGTADIAPAA